MRKRGPERGKLSWDHPTRERQQNVTRTRAWLIRTPRSVLQLAFEGKTWSCFYERRMSVKMNGEPRTERYHPVTGGFRRPPPGLGAAALAASGRAPAWARLVQSQPPGEFLSEVSLCEAGGAAGTGRGAEARCWVTDAEPRLGHVGWQGWQGLVTAERAQKPGTTPASAAADPSHWTLLLK